MSSNIQNNHKLLGKLKGHLKEKFKFSSKPKDATQRCFEKQCASVLLPNKADS